MPPHRRNARGIGGGHPCIYDDVDVNVNVNARITHAEHLTHVYFDNAHDATNTGLVILQGRKIHQRGACILYYTYLYLYFVLYLYFWAPATRDRCGGPKRDGASCLGCTFGTWLCSMSNSFIYHVSCYRFVSQHTYIYQIGPHAHVDTDSDSDSRQQQRPPAPAPAVAQIIQNNTKSSPLYYVLYVLIVLCIVLCIMYVDPCHSRLFFAAGVAVGWCGEPPGICCGC
jgi:hypothetical protein